MTESDLLRLAWRTALGNACEKQWLLAARYAVGATAILNLIYRSPDNAPPPEPVRWPESSHILIPPIKEDGALEFGGPLPEALDCTGSLTDGAQRR